MNGNASVFDRVMERFRFVAPVPVEVQRHIRRVKRREFLAVLRRAGAYSSLFALISTIFFAFKKLGIPITIVKAAVVMGVSAAIMLGGAASGVYYTVRVFVNPGMKREMHVETRELPIASAPGAEIGSDPATAVAEPPELVEKRFGVQGFKGANVDAKTSSRVSVVIAGELAKLKGTDRVMMGSSKGKKAGMLLLGSVEELGGAYTITARVVSVKDGRILYYASETAESAGDLEGASIRLTRKIASGVR